jgi:Holliday junction resolvase RusA-like endonuclease
VIIIALPEPPSVNRLFGVSSIGRRYKTPEYRDWIDECDVCVLGQRATKKRISGPYTVRLEVSSKSRKDADNMTKACIDYLVRITVVDDDKHCQQVTAVKIAAIDKGQCRVIIAPWEDK